MHSLSKPKTALVLSSGGMFGAYQAGVWQFLSTSGFEPDLVIGASVGALNGWAIAAGCSGGELAERWLDESRCNVLRRRSERGWRSILFQPEPLQRLTDEIFSAYRPNRPFGLVTVELPFLRTRLFTGEAITARHLLASASIPIAMPWVSIDGKAFTDGGLLEDVPLWAALEMGATRIVAVDSMHFDSPWWYRLGVGPIGLFAPRTKIANAQITLIRPPRSLGHFTTAMQWKTENIESWIERGYEDASCCVK